MHAAEQIVVFAVFALVLGGLLRHLLRSTPIPYTVVLLVAGLVIGAGGKAGWFADLPIGEAVDAAAHVNPHVILLIFLPTLIFESAFSMDVHVFRRSLWQVLLLAIPGLLIATVGAGLLAKGLLPGEWSWPAALMFGALVSATDPVAVVALLKELGVSKRLSTLVEGESLFNDGTAIVVFLLFFGLVADGGSISAIATGSTFLLTAVGGLALGFALGAGLLVWLRRIYNDALVEITLTIVAAYLTYYLAEHLHVSGVLAVVAIGLCVAAGGRTRISPDVHGFLHHFWELAAYLANTVIFVLVGIVVAYTTPAQFEAGAVIRLLLLFLGLQIVRAVTVTILMPWLRRSGYGLTWREATVLTWSGLRGAVGLALALVVAGDPRIAPHVGDATIQYGAGIVVLSLVINGSTIRPLLRWLGIMKLSPGAVNLRKHAADRLHDLLDRERSVLRQDRFLGGADWRQVSSWEPAVPSEAPTHGLSDVRQEASLRLFELEKRSFWHQYRLGRLGAAAVVRLIESVDTEVDNLLVGSSPLATWNPWRMPHWVALIMRFPAAGSLARRLAGRRIALTYDMARGSVVALDELLRHVDEFAEDESVRESLRAVCNQRRRAAQQALTTIHTHYPEIAVAVETGCARRMLLNSERRSITRLAEDGVLDDAAARNWTDAVEAQLKTVWSREDVALPSLDDMLWHVEWLRELPNDTFAAVKTICRERIFPAGDDLIRQGDTDGRIVVIVRGTVAVIQGPGTGTQLDSLGPGAVIGEIGALSNAPRSATVRAETTVTAGVIEQAALRTLLSQAPLLERSLWRTAALRLAENLLRTCKPWSDWPVEDLRRRLLQAELCDWDSDSELAATATEGILITGEVTTAEGQCLTPPEIISLKQSRPTTACRILVCPALREREITR